MNHLRTDYNCCKLTVPIFFFIIILFFSAWVRFDGITDRDIPGRLVWLYKGGKNLAAGQPPNFAVFFN